MKSWIKNRIGFLFLRWTLELLPHSCWQWQTLTSEGRERREHERHEGYMLLLGASPLPFELWRVERRADTRPVTVRLPRQRGPRAVA